MIELDLTATAHEMQVFHAREQSLECGIARENFDMIRKLKSGKYRLYSRKVDPKTGKRKNLGTFDTREAATEHERAVQYFKHQR